MTKKHAQRQHAKRRAEERFGLHLNRDDYRDMVRLVRSGGGKFVGRESLRLSHWEITWPRGPEGVLMHAVYDSKRGTIVTVMPPSRDGAGDKLTGEAPGWFREIEERRSRC